jgi:hypothetical protein
VLPGDETPIPDETALYRRINPDPAAPHLVWDDNLNCRRISTGAFRDPDLSVVLGDRLEALQRQPETVLDGYADYYLVVFRARAATDADPGLTVLRDPTPSEPAHGAVRGKKRKPVMRAIARACEWVVKPDDGCEPPYPELPQP